MNKEQAEKHSEVIKWGCDNPDNGVWCNLGIREDPDWYLTNTPTFNKDYTYLQNDEYAKFRKALAEGKSIQYRNGYIWVDISIATFAFPVETYRIKPDEPKFKVGDWVKDKSSGFIIQAYKDMISKNFEKWKPEQGELCAFWDEDDDKYYGIGKYSDTDNSGKHLCDTISGRWDNIAPLEFVNTLKEK